MWIYIGLFLIGVIVQASLMIMWKKEKKNILNMLLKMGYVFLNVLVVFFHGFVNILFSCGVIVVEDIIQMIIQSFGFLIMCKITNDLFYIVMEKMWMTSVKEIDVFNKDFEEWKEKVFGLIWLLTTANDIVLGIIDSRQEYFIQATFTCVVFIGFFISLKSLLCGRNIIEILKDKETCKKIPKVVYEKWINDKKIVIAMLILFFIFADVMLMRKTEVIEISLAFLVFSTGIICVVVFSKFIKKLF